MYKEILLPPHAPKEYADRSTLWNAVEKAEEHPKAQLAYSYDIALQNKLTMEENIALARRFLQEQFVSRGMICDFAVHLPDPKTAFPIHISTSCALSGLLIRMEHGGTSKNGNTHWTKMADVFGTLAGIISGNPSPPRTGDKRKPCFIGDRNGQIM